jgi:type IV pilus assembly protein PilB
MFEGHDQAVAVLLREAGLLSPAALARLGEECRATGESFAGAAVDRGLVGRAEMLRGVAAHLGLRCVEELPPVIPEAIAASVSGELAQRYGVVPWRADHRSIVLLAIDPFDSRMAGDLSFALGKEVQLAVADPAWIAKRLSDHYGPGAMEAGRLAAGVYLAASIEENGAEFSAADLERQAAETPVVRFVNRILRQAVRDQASDVHFEPFEGDFKVRCRVDGTLRDESPPPPRYALPVISRLKVLAGLNIAERRVPQDGRIRFPVDGRCVDLRMSTLPTQAGESVVLRVLDQTTAPLTLPELGLSAAVEAGVREIVHRPNGILLVTGPTGSGKTTTLYGCLRIINTPELKILTAEDPVEYEIEGILQLPVNAAIGLTFALALRSFLRQDPDVLMVGEIRDLETGRIAIQAALTGHLVLSTLHTNDAVGAVARLVDMGVEPFLLASTLEGVLAQRLARRICPLCREPVEPSAALLAEFNFEPAQIEGHRFFRGGGCAACRQTGYKGRIGLFEWLKMSESLRELVLQRAPAPAIQRLAVASGMETLRAAGLRAVFDGLTTLEEVRRYV